MLVLFSQYATDAFNWVYFFWICAIDDRIFWPGFLFVVLAFRPFRVLWTLSFGGNAIHGVVLFFIHTPQKELIFGCKLESQVCGLLSQLISCNLKLSCILPTRNEETNTLKLKSEEMHWANCRGCFIFVVFFLYLWIAWCANMNCRKVVDWTHSGSTLCWFVFNISWTYLNMSLLMVAKSCCEACTLLCAFGGKTHLCAT